MKIISPTNVVVKLTPHSKERNVHVNQIKHYYHEEQGPSYFESVPTTDEPEEFTDDSDEAEKFATPTESPVKTPTIKIEPPSEEEETDESEPEPTEPEPEPEKGEEPIIETPVTSRDPAQPAARASLFERAKEQLQRAKDHVMEKSELSRILEPPLRPQLTYEQGQPATVTEPTQKLPKQSKSADPGKTISTQTQTSPEEAEKASTHGRQLRSAGPVQEVRLPKRPPEYKPYRKHKRGTSV
jgi:hypothetical protein